MPWCPAGPAGSSRPGPVIHHGCAKDDVLQRTATSVDTGPDQSDRPDHTGRGPQHGDDGTDVLPPARDDPQPQDQGSVRSSGGRPADREIEPRGCTSDGDDSQQRRRRESEGAGVMQEAHRREPGIANGDDDDEHAGVDDVGSHSADDARSAHRDRWRVRHVRHMRHGARAYRARHHAGHPAGSETRELPLLRCGLSRSTALEIAVSASAPRRRTRCTASVVSVVDELRTMSGRSTPSMTYCATPRRSTRQTMALTSTCRATSSSMSTWRATRYVRSIRHTTARPTTGMTRYATRAPC